MIQTGQIASRVDSDPSFGTRRMRLLRALCSAFYAFERRDRYPHGMRSGWFESCQFCRFVIGRVHSLRLSSSKLPSPFFWRVKSSVQLKPLQSLSRLFSSSQKLRPVNSISSLTLHFTTTPPSLLTSATWRNVHASTHRIQHDGLW